jgi:non-ribosomal peptide synthetase component F
VQYHGPLGKLNVWPPECWVVSGGMTAGIRGGGLVCRAPRRYMRGVPARPAREPLDDPCGARSVEDGLGRRPANHVALTPTGFLQRAAAVYPHKPAVIHGEHTCTYAEFYARARRLASALARRGIGVGDTVAVMAPNVPAMLEAHYGVPMAGAVLNALNYRLDARTIAFILQHGGAKLLRAILALQIPGDFVEGGVWRGGASFPHGRAAAADRRLGLSRMALRFL